MKLSVVAVALCWILSSIARADPKEDFINAVVNQCKMPREKAESFATPGRTGTIVQFTLCISSKVDVGEDCKIACKRQGSSIGG